MISFVPVRGGDLAVGGWHASAPGLPVVGVHGITAHHQSWQRVAEKLPGSPFIAPDLRGRGRSRELPAGTLNEHADDVARVLDARGVERAVFAGHSMGAFVGVRFAARHADRLAGLVLVDGGLPLPPPPPLPDGRVPTPEDLLGPAIQRLSLKFPSVEAYRDFWKQHPAFGPYWDEYVQAYVDYDLQGEAPELYPSAVGEAVVVNLMEFNGFDPTPLADVRVSVKLLRAERDLVDQPPGLYPPEHLAALLTKLPNVELIEVADCNHYGIALAENGARAVAAAIEEVLS